MASDRLTRLVMGAGRYTADVPHADALHGAFVRSDRARARILAVETEAAAAMPGVVGVFVATDLGPFGAFPAALRYRDRAGAPLRAPARHPIAADEVRHLGEIVAVVVAATRAQAVAAADAVAVTFDDMPPVVGLDGAFATGAPLVHAEVPENLAIEVEAGDAARTATALAGAAHRITLTVTLPRLAPSPMEPRSALATYDTAAGRYTLAAPHQGAPEVRRDLSTVLGVAEDAIDVVAEHVGGAFGARGPAYPEHALLLELAQRLGRPVRWEGSRLEAFLADHQGRGTRLTGTLGLAADGAAVGLDVLYEADLGAYASPVGAHINVHNPLQTLTGAYRIPLASARFRLAYTNAVPIGPYRGAGRPDIAFLIERLMDEAARQTGIDRVALRRRNLVDAFPHTTPVGVSYDSGDYPRLLDEALEGIGWATAAARAADAAAAGLLHGIGLALFVEVAGGGPVAHDEVRLRLEPSDLPRIVIETLAQSTGQPQDEALAAIAAEALGLEPGRIEVRAVAQGLAGSGGFASRTTATAGSAVLDACRTLLAQLGGALPAGAIPAVTVLGRAGPAITFPSGCHAAEVLIDPDTGVVRLSRYVAVDDVGRILSREAIDAQIHGGIAQGLGGALFERVVSDDTGQLLTASFMDYAMPRAGDLPALTTCLIEIPSPSTPLGVKGVGEAGTTGALAAVANAVNHALSEAGSGPVDMPLTPLAVWRALHG